MDAIGLLKRDHEKVKGLFEKFEEAESGDAKRGIVEEIARELRIHETIEEEIFYPALKRKADAEGRKLVLEGVQEHHVADLLLEEIAALDPEDEAYDAKVEVLKENIEHHIEEEEGDVFAEAEDALGDDLESLGARMEKRKKELEARKEVPAPPSKNA